MHDGKGNARRIYLKDEELREQRLAQSLQEEARRN
jgi:hypothetical protein